MIENCSCWRFLVPIFVLAMVAAEASAADPDPKDVKRAARLSQQGDAALREGDLPRAAEKFDDSLGAVPGFALAHIGLGHVSMRTGDYQSALRNYKAAKIGYAELGSAMLSAETQRYAGARRQIQEFQDSISQLQGSGSIRAPMQISQLQNAIEQLEAIEPPIETDMTEPPAELDFYIGNALFRLENLNEAVLSWERCAERNPKYAMVRNNLALGYWRQGRLNLAVTSLDRAEELGFSVNPQFKIDLAAAAGSR